MLGSIRNATWFALRPEFWPHAFVLAKRKFGPRGKRHSSAADRAAADAWAKERIVGIDTALVRLGLIAEGTAIPTLDPALIAEGQQRAAASGVTMGGSGGIDAIHAVVMLTKAQRVVETGVAYGWSTLAILSALEKTGGRLVSVDMPYRGQGLAESVGCAVPDRLRGPWTLIRLPDRPGLKRAIAALGGTIDLAHYDSDKSYHGREYAYPLIWDALRPGGVFMSDDIHDNFGFRDFMAKVGARYEVVMSGKSRVGIAVKP